MRRERWEETEREERWENEGRSNMKPHVSSQVSSSLSSLNPIPFRLFLLAHSQPAQFERIRNTTQYRESRSHIFFAKVERYLRLRVIHLIFSLNHNTHKEKERKRESLKSVSLMKRVRGSWKKKVWKKQELTWWRWRLWERKLVEEWLCIKE